MGWTWRDNITLPVVKEDGICKKKSQHKFCPFWVSRKSGNTVISFHCDLFNLTKPGKSSLDICNSTYGRTYEGNP